MANLDTKYMGLDLRNPLIVGSSGLTATLPKLRELEEAGAGAVVLKSVFEEQLRYQISSLENYDDRPEAVDYLKTYLNAEYLFKYTKLIREAKKSLAIPVIGSICCIDKGKWAEYAQRIEAEGADALELNIFVLPADQHKTSRDIEKRYLSIVETVTSAVSLPVAVKIGPRFTNIFSVIDGIMGAGAKAVVMFNRFYEPDIDITNMSITTSDFFSNPSELRNSLRWLAIASSRFPQLDIAASTGIHTGEDAVKVILAGTAVYEVCSAIYTHGPKAIERINGFVSNWMDAHGFCSTEQFKGRVNYSSVSNPAAYERAQFRKYFSFRE